MARKNDEKWVDLKNQPVPEGQHLLEVDDLKMYFHTQDGVVKAVNGVSYTLDRGETLGVVGESGSGKSVTSLTIMGLIDMPPGRIEGGDVRYRGRSLLEMSEEQMQSVRGNDIAMIFQDPMTSLNPVYTIGRQLGEGLRLHRGYTKQQATQRAIELLDLVGIPNPEQRVKDYPHQFSGGMRQRVMIAMALACDPDILIADEPTTALDVTIQAQIIELMQEMQEKNGRRDLLPVRAPLHLGPYALDPRAAAEREEAAHAHHGQPALARERSFRLHVLAEVPLCVRPLPHGAPGARLRGGGPLLHVPLLPRPRLRRAQRPEASREGHAELEGA